MNAPCYETSGAPIFSFVSYLVREKSRVEVSLHLARARFAHELDGAKTAIFPPSSSCAFRARARWR